MWLWGCVMRGSAVVLLVSALFLGVAPGGPAAAEDVGHVVSVDVDPGPFQVQGFAGQAQSVITAVIDEPSFEIGTARQVEWSYSGVEAVLERLSGGPYARVSVDLVRVATAGSVGTFSAPWRIASSRTGTWTLTRLTWGSGGPSVDPRVALGATRTIAVVGSGAPTATVSRVPKVLPYTSSFGPRPSPQTLILTYRSALGAPIVGATVLVGTEYACFGNPVPPTRGSPGWWGFRTLRTSSLGQITWVLSDLAPCVFLLGPPATAGDPYTRALVRVDRPLRLYRYAGVAAAPVARTVRLGRSVTVVGRAIPALGVARLQRLVGRTWRTIASARVRTSGRYTVVAPVGSVGRRYYRVVAVLPPSPQQAFALAATASRAFVVTGVR